MEASAISSATSSLQQQYSLSRPTQEVERPRSSETTQNTTNTQQSPSNQVTQTNQTAQQTQNVQNQNQQDQQPKPVVNAQGQKIGSIINETA